MELYKISQTVNNKINTYTAAVVVAANQNTARYIHPSGFQENYDIVDGKMKPWFKVQKPLFNDWCKPEEVKLSYLGETPSYRKEGVIVASYNGRLSLEELGLMDIDVNHDLIEKLDNYYLDIEEI